MQQAVPPGPPGPPAPPGPPGPPGPPPPYSEPAAQDRAQAQDSAQPNLTANYTVNTFGFGRNHNENLLKGIAEVGNGLYFFIETKETLGEAFVDCIGGLLSVVGQDLQVKIAPGDGVQLLDVLTHYDKARDAQGAITMRIKDIQSEESRDIVCTVKLPELECPGSTDVLSASLVYNNVIREEKASATTVISLPRPDSNECKHLAPNLYVDEQKNRMITATALTGAADLAEQSHFDKAKAVLTTAIETVKNSPSNTQPYSGELVKSMEDTRANFQDRSQYLAHGGGKAARASCRSHQMQRSNLQCAGYANKKKSAMKSGWAMSRTSC